MVTPPSIITDRRGRTVVVKAGTGELADRRRHEAEILGRSRHPGVVELLDVTDDGDRVELHLDHVAGPSIALHAPLGPGALVRVGAAVAETLADLHGSGVAHGHLAADHVLVTDDERVVLCGFADAATADERSEAADLVALARLLARQLDRAADTGVAGATGPAADELRALTEETVAGGAPTSARILAARLAAIGDIADSDSGRRSVRASMRLHRRAVLVASAVVALTAVAGLIAARSFGPGRSNAAAVESTTVPTVATTPVPVSPRTAPESVPATAPTTVAATAPSTTAAPPQLVLPAPTPCEPVEAGLSAADVDGDGCPDGWRADGGVIEVGSLRYALGDEADLVTVGDWDCDGSATPALVRSGSGGVFLFPRWASDGDDVTVDAVGVVAGATAADPVALDGCDALSVTGPDGTIRFGGQP